MRIFWTTLISILIAWTPGQTCQAQFQEHANERKSNVTSPTTGKSLTVPAGSFICTVDRLVDNDGNELDVRWEIWLVTKNFEAESASQVEEAGTQFRWFRQTVGRYGDLTDLRPSGTVKTLQPAGQVFREDSFGQQSDYRVQRLGLYVMYAIANEKEQETLKLKLSKPLEFVVGKGNSFSRNMMR